MIVSFWMPTFSSFLEFDHHVLIVRFLRCNLIQYEFSRCLCYLSRNDTIPLCQTSWLTALVWIDFSTRRLSFPLTNGATHDGENWREPYTREVRKQPMFNPYVHNELVSLSWQSFFAGSTRAGRVTIFENITCTWTDRTHRRYDLNLISYKFLCRCSQNRIAIWTVWPSGGLSRPLIGYELPDHVYESNGPLSTR